jgi:hypothetical protein
MSKRPTSRTSKTAAFTAANFFSNDYQKTLFPLRTNKILAETGFSKLLNFGRNQAQTAEKEKDSSAFLPQRRVFAMKASWHLRRTVKLDPVAEVILYDLVFRNRALFRKSFSNSRECFGYQFSNGKPLDATSAYKGFKGAFNDYGSKFKFGISFDVASYFNSIYHHDLVNWFDERGAAEPDVSLFGRFLREINAGRSIDCLPQGLYPSKMIGNDFLKFIDNSSRLRSTILIRFMDDVALFSDRREDLFADFYLIQDLLGQKGLSVNPSKTRLLEETRQDVGEKIDAVRKGLLKKRRILIIRGYDVEVEEREVSRKLTPKEISLLKTILAQPQLEEEDAELVLSLMGAHSADVFARFDDLLREFPNLAKSMYVFSRNIADREALAQIILEYLKQTPVIPEYQLFWIGMMAEDYLLKTKSAGELLNVLYAHPWATAITKAKVLEIPEARFGLPELREEQLKEGKSDWLSWSAAVGSRNKKKASRNYVLNYFKNGSPMNGVIADVVSSLP